jgi:integrase
MGRRRGTGSIFKRPGCETFSIKFTNRGRAIRESTGSCDFSEAVKQLNKRLAEIDKGIFVEPETRRIEVRELAEDFLDDYRINRRKSLPDAEARWRLHLEPFFGAARAVEVGTSTIAKYIRGRLEQGASNGSINREIAALKRMFKLGFQAAPKKVASLPYFGKKLVESDPRQGFVEDEQYSGLAGASTEIWFRALLEVAHTYAWRRQEVLDLRVRQVDLVEGTIRLDVGSTKNKAGRTITMTSKAALLLAECVRGKAPDDPVFTRKDGKPVRDFRQSWAAACVAAGVGKMICKMCETPTAGEKCENCGAQGKGLRYSGLMFHDLRRTGARNLRRAGVAEGVIMKIGGWKTASVFRRYDITNQADIVDALQKLDQHREERIELERQIEERRQNPTFFDAPGALESTNSVPIGAFGPSAGVGAKSRRVN